jgi:cysteinyl-tRNA synthetase
MNAGAPVRFFNSLGRKMVDFPVPRQGHVGLYSCGPTVYSVPHLGNLRAYVFSDTLRRLLEWKGCAVTQVINITDVGHAVGDGDEGEDKVEVAARSERRSVREVTDRYTQMFFDDLAALNVRPASNYPRASSYVPQMIEFAQVLEAEGYTYVLPSGLYFDTSKSQGYGRLAMMPQTGQMEGGRVSEEGKRSAADFAIWRSDPPEQRRIMRWDSPWGPGVPGWHLECSVMSMALLGRHFDIHTGGVDHRELHHVNEIAQSEAYLGDGIDWVPLWMHNEFLLLGGAKISKSAGRMPTLRDLTEAGQPAMAFRYFLLMAHYRSQQDLTDGGLSGASSALRRLLGRVEPIRPLPVVRNYGDAHAQLGAEGRLALDRFDAAISDDLGTPRALAEFQGALRAPDLSSHDKAVLAAAADQALGLDLAGLAAASPHAATVVPSVPAERIEELVAAREAARKGRDWAMADQVRAELADLGVQVTDTPDGPRWSLAATK